MENQQQKTETSTSKQKTNNLLSQDILRPKQANTRIHQLDIYETDEENFQPYKSGETNLGLKENSNDDNTETITEDEEDSESFKLHQGEIKKTYLYNQLYELNFNRDYENPTGQGKTKLKYTKEDLKKFYKGQRLLLKCGRENEKQKYTKEEINSLIDAREKELTQQLIERKKRLITQHKETETKTKSDIEKEKQSSTSKTPDFNSKTTIYIVNNKDTEEEIKEKQALNKKGVETSTPTEEEKKQIKKLAKEEVIQEITGLEHSILGWIVEENISGDGIDLNINDYGKLLEQKDKLTYENMYRSKILEEVIKTAGLIPIIDFTNLQDDVISWTSVSSNNDNENVNSSKQFNECSQDVPMCNALKTNVAGYGKIPANITPEMYASIGKSSAPYASEVKGKNAKEVWNICKKGLKYCKYECNRDKCATDSYKKKSNPGLNCGDSARYLKCCMDVAGIPCIIIHTPGHFYNAVKYNGKWVTADLCYVNNSRGTNQLMN